MTDIFDDYCCMCGAYLHACGCFVEDELPYLPISHCPNTGKLLTECDCAPCGVRQTEEPKESVMPIRKTERGFDVYEEFKDTYGNVVRVQQSSSATQKAVWVFVDGNNLTNTQGAHLNKEQAEKIIAALQEWVEKA